MDSDIRQRLYKAATNLQQPTKPKPGHDRMTTSPQTPPLPQPTVSRTLPRNRILKKRWPYILSAIIILAVAASAVLYFRASAIHNPVPIAVQKSVPFTIYFPNQKKLPAGYNLDIRSFSASSEAVVYAITYGPGKNIAITAQQKPDNAAIQSLYSQVASRTTISTPAGTATVGSLNGKAFAGIPTKTGVWLLATAPASINTGQFKAVLQTLTH